jgi:hypothetical protein
VIAAAIDPGREGAVAFIDAATGRGWGEGLDTTDAGALAELLRAHAPQAVGVEVPVGRPPNTGGYAQISQQWRAIGCAEGVVLAIGLPLLRVRPQQWQQVAFCARAKPANYAERKRLSLRLARERWPGAHLDRMKDSGVADALWIAYLVSRQQPGKEN